MKHITICQCTQEIQRAVKFHRQYPKIKQVLIRLSNKSNKNCNDCGGKGYKEPNMKH